MGLAPAPVNAWPLAWITLAPLWLLTQVHTPRRAILLGAIWGTGYHGTALAWITDLHPLTWMGIPWLASIAIALFCWIFITLWGAAISTVWAGVMSRLSSRQPVWGRTLLGIALWCSLEWLWSRSPLWWTSLSYTQSPGNLAILHLGQLSGPLTVTAAIVLINGLVVEALLGTNKNWRRLGLAAGLLISIHFLGFGLYRLPLTQAPETALKVGVIQGNVPTRIKLYSEGLRRAFEGYTTGYQKLVDQGVDAVLTPEGALPFLLVQPNQMENSFSQAVQSRGVVAWLGTFGNHQDGVTRSLLTMTGNGVFSRYDKVKLVPLGEYIPWEDFLGKVVSQLSPIDFHGLAGQPDQQFDTPFGRAIVGICFDSAFSYLFQAQAAAGGQFILTASNNDPYGPAMLAQHHAQDIMRAIETDRWSVRATNTGYSGIVDPHGITRWLSRIKTYETHAATVYRRQTQTLYVRWGDWLTPLLAVLAAVAWVVNGKNASRE